MSVTFLGIQLMPGPLEELQTAIERGQALILVGAGVSIGATRGQVVAVGGKTFPLASWTGLLQHGVTYCEQWLKDLPPGWAEAVRAEINVGDCGSLIGAGTKIEEKLKAPEGPYLMWLESSVGSLEIIDGSVLEAIAKLGLPIATTNYDSLLEANSAQPTVNWTQEHKVQRILRGHAKGIIHLHGDWDDPRSVVLGHRTYAAVERDFNAQAILRTVFASRTVLLVGFGGGLSDPNFGPLLKWAAKAFASSPYPHFLLCLEKDLGSLRLDHPIQPLVYGETHADLAPFLRTLKPAADSGDGRRNPVPLFDVPHARNRFFTGRDDTLARLHAAMTAADPPARIWAVSGMGGVGKTQTTLEYAYRYRDHYRTVFWVRADSTTALNSDFARIAASNGFRSGLPDDPAEIRNWVKHWLGSEGGYLLILDNVDDPEAIRPFLPSEPKGNILMTSRAPNLESLGVAETIELSEMGSGEATAFLFARTGRPKDDREERAAAESLAQELGYLPLALEQAAAFITLNEYLFQDYLKDFHALRLDLLNQGVNQVTAQQTTVRTCWQKSFAAVELESAAAADLLTLSAFLGPDRIPYDLLEQGAPALGGPLGEALGSPGQARLPLSRLLTLLRRYALIRRDMPSRAYNIHRLIQAVIREKQDAGSSTAYAERCVRAVNEAFPWVHFASWPLCERLVPHALVCAGWVEKYDLVTAESGRMLNQAAFYLKERGQYAAAEPLFQRAMAVREASCGEWHLDTAQTCNDMATLYNNQGRYAEAEPHHRRALEIREGNLGREAPVVGGSLKHLSRVLRNLDRDEEAESLGLRALAIAEASLGPKNHRVAECLCNLAVQFNKLGRYTEAEPLATRGLSICKEVLQPGHPGIGYSLTVLGDLYQSSGRYGEAEPLYREAINIDEAALHPEHPIVLSVMGKLASLLRRMGREDEAQSMDSLASVRSRRIQG